MPVPSVRALPLVPALQYWLIFRIVHLYREPHLLRLRL